MEPIRELIAVDLEMTGLQVKTVAGHVSDICESASQD